ncbi:MAG TPA: hypothetical protein VMF86_14845 [Stellaceae bacterium]|nr:hypothetical protein [Stellaceae bacterium]
MARISGSASVEGLDEATAGGGADRRAPPLVVDLDGSLVAIDTSLLRAIVLRGRPR